MIKQLSDIKRWPGLPIFIIVVFLVILNSILTKNFFSSNVMQRFLSTYAPLIFVTLAQTLVIMSGGIDLSLGGIISLTNVTTIVLIGAGWDFLKVGPSGGLYICNTPGACQAGWPFIWAALGGIIIGLLIGLINAIAVGILRVRPFLATLATQFISMGMALYLLPLPGGHLQKEIITFYIRPFLGIPIAGWAIAILVIFWVFLIKSPYGYHLKATGNSMQKAYNSGVPVLKTIFGTYLLSAFIASLGGVLLTMSITAGDSTVGAAFTMNSIAAVVLGGVSMSGGEGEVGGPIFGALFLGLIVNTILGARVPAFYQWLVSGVVIVLGLIASVYLKALMRSRKQA